MRHHGRSDAAQSGANRRHGVGDLSFDKKKGGKQAGADAKGGGTVLDAGGKSGGCTGETGIYENQDDGMTGRATK